MQDLRHGFEDRLDHVRGLLQVRPASDASRSIVGLRLWLSSLSDSPDTAHVHACMQSPVAAAAMTWCMNIMLGCVRPAVDLL